MDEIDLHKREWCYFQLPSAYEITCDKCGGTNTTWSEYEKMIWCWDCNIDTHGTGGIFNGPILLEVSKMMGISFDRIRLSDNAILKMEVVKGKIIYEEN